ncbi:MAG: hypothetical protein QXW56_02620 [Nitrososphaerota archaeon]
MSSSGPGSVLVFLSFVTLSALLFGIYVTAYLGTLYAGEQVRREGEAASEQAIIYLYQHPMNISVIDGSPVLQGETRIVVQNVGPRDISFDRVLAISPDGSIAADVKVPGNKGLGARQWQMYRVQDLGLPERWSNFTVFRSEVSRLVLLSGRGRTHGSIWGVPPFLEGIIKAYLTTTVTTTMEYSYITTTSFATTYTITIPFRQSGYSVTAEWWEGNNKVTSARGRGNGEYLSYEYTPCCPSYYWQAQSPPASELVDGSWTRCAQYYGCWSGRHDPYVTLNGQQILSLDAPPIIKYFKAGERVTVQVSDWATSYSISWSSQYCYQTSVCRCLKYEGSESTGWRCVESQCEYYCYANYREGGATYRLQAIELVDWDTGEVYASINQSSIQFEVYRNTIVRLKYVQVDSWSRSWQVVWRKPPEPSECERILNDPSAVGTPEWCECAKRFNIPGWEEKCPVQFVACIFVSVSPCCVGDEKYACLDSWSERGGSACVPFTEKECREGVAKPVETSWSASWSLKPGWTFAGLGKVGDATCSGSASGSSASGYCRTMLTCNRASHNRIIIIFQRASAPIIE